jgi:hypothetical protein
MDQKLQDLIRRKTKPSGNGESVDWDDRREKYLKAVEDLYALMASVLADPIADGTVKVRRRPKDLTEDYLGTYAVDDLLLLFGDEQVRFSPRGRNILGAEGRVDVVGERGEANLILRDAAWWLVQARQPRLRTARLDDSTIADVLNLVMRD